MLNEVKTGLGRYLGRWYEDLIPTTKAMRDYIDRGLAKSIVWGPGRQVDNADDMLSSYRKNDNDLAPGLNSHLPIVIIAMSRDLIPALEWGRSQGNVQDVIFPEDPKGRAFKLRQVLGEIRLQLAFFAADEPTARSLAMQFEMYISDAGNRRFMCPYRFAGFDFEWPCMIETPDVFINHTPNEQINMCILSMDLTLRVTVPLASGPRDGEENDGKGTTPQFGDDPSGYLLTSTVTMHPTDADLYISHVVQAAPNGNDPVQVVTTRAIEPLP